MMSAMFQLSHRKVAYEDSLELLEGAIQIIHKYHVTKPGLLMIPFIVAAPYMSIGIVGYIYSLGKLCSFMKF